MLPENPISLNAAQRQRLLITCKHIDKLLTDIESALHSADSNTVFPNFVNDVSPAQRKEMEASIAQVRGHLLRVIAGQSLVAGEPRISVLHSIHVMLTFVDIAITELAPHYMRGYGPVSSEGVADLNAIVDELRSAMKGLTQQAAQPHDSDFRERAGRGKTYD